MLKRRWLSLILAIAMVLTVFTGTMIVSAEQTEGTEMVIDSQSGDVVAAADAVNVDFTKMSVVPVYSASNGQGFVSVSGAIMPTVDGKDYRREVAPTDKITVSAEGAKVTESNGSYLHKKNNSNDGDDFNHGGLIYRVDTGAAGAYHLEVEITGTSADTRVAPTGMDAGGLTKTSNWDNCNHVLRTVSAVWEDSKWSYDFATGENFIEIEIEPSTLPTADKPQTVGVKSIKITPLDVNAAGAKPTIHILGDSTQKTYSFNETISAWGQTLKNYFDLNKVNVVNYSMGGRAMKSNYCEGRANEALIRGKQGDFVFIHSAHNDETVSTNRFSRGAGSKSNDLTVNNANYNKWLDMYVSAIKARGMTPVLVTAMPRVNGSTGAPNSGFNPDSPANMKAKAKADSDVAVADLYEGAKAYIKKLDGKEVAYIYNNTEAGETPAANAANGANGDGTHYREAASKQWCRIILQSIYDQSVASTDTYTDKAICQELVSLMPSSVVNAASTGNWSAVFPEMASDVSAVDVVPGATKQTVNNFYYRNNIEKALQLGLLHKDSNNLFKPTQTITVGEYARGIEKAFGLAENSLTNYTKTYDELKASNITNVLAAAGEEEAVVEAASEDVPVIAEADGYTVTVNQAEGGTVTVYNNSAFKTATADIPAGVTAKKVVSDNAYFTLTAPETITAGSDKSGALADGISANYVEFRNDSEGKDFAYTAKADGVLTVYARTGNNKAIELKGADNTLSASINPEGSGNVYGFVTFNVKSGETYQLYTRGGTGRLFGVKYESTDYPQSTESLAVNSGDEIRVVAIPTENHVNGSILVNGEEKATAKEYTFKATGNTIVSATFVAEPALVDGAIATDAALTREAMGAILYDAYQEFQKSGSDDAKKNMQTYMGNNGGVPSPDDPNYDPNIQYEGTPYIPLTGWGALTDTSALSDSLYAKVKAAYNLGLIRTEKGIARASISNGTELEPKAEVTRAKAAKSLVFAFILTQLPSEESQMIPNNENLAAQTVAEITAPNPAAPSVPLTKDAKYDYEITKAEFDTNGNLSVELSYSGTEANPTAKLLVAAYDKNDSKVMTSSAVFDVEGTTVKDLFFVNPGSGETVKLYVWDGTDSLKPLSEVATAFGSAESDSTPLPTDSCTTPGPVQTLVPTQTPKPDVNKVTVVTAAGETFEFDTIREAVAKAKDLNPQTEADRVTINVNPGNYEEQVRIDGMKYLTIQQTPNTSGRVNLSWYFCTGYCTSNTDLTGLYDPTIDWSREETWNGYKEGDEKFTKYKIGQKLDGISTISYYDINGVAHKDVAVNSQLKNLGGLGWSYDKMAALIVTQSSSDITIKDFNIVNSVPVMKIEAELDGHLTPEEGSTLLDHSALSICSEDTPMVKPSDDIYDSNGAVNKDKYKKVVAAGRTFNAGESAWLLKSSIFNERGHAIATLGDRVIFENVRARGNQDSIWASDGRVYFKNCTLIGGTDYIYGSAAAVFDSCKLGFAGFTDYSYGNPLGTPNTPVARKYGYLFWNCTVYNECDNGGVSNFGGPWGDAGQSTFYNTLIDDNGTVGNSGVKIDPKGWGRFGAENGLSRMYEYGTKNTSGKAVDFSQRVVNKSVEEGGPGMGTVLDQWQILEFNPRNYFSKDSNDSKWAENWDPMNFGESMAKVDAAIAGVTVNIPSNEETTIALPIAPNGVTFKWESASTNAIVSADGKNITVVRPAAGGENVETTVTLYAMDNENKFGDKKEIPVIITPTTNTTDVFNIPVSIEQSANAQNTYIVTISKDGALIKQQEIEVVGADNTVSAVIENIPASAAGIDYDVKIVSKSDEFTVTAPEEGITAVKGITGRDVELKITSQKIVDKYVNLNISTKASDGNKTYDLIALAKENGATEDIMTSEIISVEFDVDLKAKPSKTSYIDISSGAPSNANSATAQRFTMFKINDSWTQIDTVDNTQGFSGSSNSGHQCLNITGKFDYSKTNTVKATINYKDKIVTIDGNSVGSGKTATPYTFESFPNNAEKGKFNMGVFVGSTADNYTISNVILTYKHIVTDDDLEE